MRKVLIESLAGALASVVGVLLCAGLYNVSERLGYEIPFGGDKGFVLFPLLFGLPLGAITGTILTEKLIYRIQGWNILGVVFGIILSVVGSFLGLVMMDKMGGECGLLIPFLVAIMCVVGYRLGLQIW